MQLVWFSFAKKFKSFHKEFLMMEVLSKETKINLN